MINKYKFDNSWTILEKKSKKWIQHLYLQVNIKNLSDLHQ